MSEVSLLVNEKDNVKKLKRKLEGWREIILQLQSILLWEKTWYPGLIAGVTTALFMLLWLLEPSLLSSISCAALLVTILDYAVPMVSANLYNPALWTAIEEKQFENICKNLVHNYSIASQQLASFKEFKSSSPKLYYSVTIFSLAVLAYIGNNINNLVLTYILVTTLLFVPGLSYHGILHKYYQLLLHSVANVLKSLNGGDKLKVN